MKEDLGRVEIPDEHEARERAWSLVRAAFAEREPVVRPRRRWRPLLAVAAGLSLVGAALSPAGGAVLREVRETIGIERAAPALFSLPTQGRLLVTSDAGAWVVAGDGSKRLLGRYREASWSPSGRFVVAARANELAALEPGGETRWKLSRAGVRFPRWGGTRTDTRIAYLSDGRLHVVAGDGTDDRRLARLARPVAPAWRPGPAHVLAYSRRDGLVRVVDADRGTVLARDRAADAVQLDWVADRRLLRTPDAVRLYDDSGRRVLTRRGRFAAAALAPRAQALALVHLDGAVSTVEVVSRRGRAQRVFTGTGRFGELAWSPDGRWLLVTWPDADQWVFVRVRGQRRIRSASNISAQFESSRFPSISGWCCP